MNDNFQVQVNTMMTLTRQFSILYYVLNERETLTWSQDQHLTFRHTSMKQKKLKIK